VGVAAPPALALGQEQDVLGHRGQPPPAQRTAV